MESETTWKIGILLSGLGFFLFTIPLGFIISFYGWISYKNPLFKKYCFWGMLISIFWIIVYILGIIILFPVFDRMFGF